MVISLVLRQRWCRRHTRHGVAACCCCLPLLGLPTASARYETVQDVFITPLHQQHTSHTLASRVHGPQPHMRSCTAAGQCRWRRGPTTSPCSKHGPSPNTMASFTSGCCSSGGERGQPERAQVGRRELPNRRAERSDILTEVISDHLCQPSIRRSPTISHECSRIQRTERKCRRPKAH